MLKNTYYSLFIITYIILIVGSCYYQFTDATVNYITEMNIDFVTYKSPKCSGTIQLTVEEWRRNVIITSLIFSTIIMVLIDFFRRFKFIKIY